MLKKIVVALLLVVGVLLIIPLFTAKDYAVLRSVEIDRPVPQVYNYIKYLKNQDNFSRWASMDPDMEKSYRGTDATVGFVSAWSSDKEDVGKGEQEILGMNENERIDYELRFLEPFESTEKAYMTTEPTADGGTKVSWGFNGRMNYPMNAMLLFMDFEGMIGQDLQTGLDNLKRIMES